MLTQKQIHSICFKLQEFGHLTLAMVYLVSNKSYSRVKLGNITKVKHYVHNEQSIYQAK